MGETSAEIKPEAGDASPSQGYGFGTFQGVFVPSILTILGVIMYLRFGWVLGNVGLFKTLIIVVLATSITFLTALSMSALATNRAVGGGGAYYIISRSLGIEAGAAVGVPLYFAQALGIAFYLSGFSEAVVGVFPNLDPTAVGLITAALLAGVVYFSADFALKTQLVILALIIASLISFFAGGPVDPAPVLAVDAPAVAPHAFWVVFAVFFPAVTGIEAGIAMSGDLKNPAKSLPWGTLGAVLTGLVVYLAIPVYLVWAVGNDEILRTDTLIMRRVARWGDLILLGVWCATLSSAMGALLGAPRTLQALARDRVVPRVIGKGFGAKNDPRIATLITFAVAAAGIVLGDLNAIAPVLSMFFLTSYGVLNISAGLEEVIGTASWRPTFRISGIVSLVGAFACFAVMFMINAGATLIALVVSGCIYYLMKRRSLKAQWGDIRFGIYRLAARYAIRELASIRPGERTWAPNLLVFSGAPSGRWYLVELANALSQGRNFVTVAILVSDPDWSEERTAAAGDSVREYLAKRDVEALVKVVTCDGQPLEGALDMVTNYGFGPLEPNTILVGETQDPAQFDAFTRLIRHVYATRKNLVMVREGARDDEQPVLKEGSRIDLWWRGKEANVGLMVTLAFLLKKSPGWTDARLIFKQIIDPERPRDEAVTQLEAYVAEQRIDADVDVLVKDGRTAYEIIRASSQGADLVLMGMPPPRDGESIEQDRDRYRILLESTDGMPPSALVLSAQDIQFHKIFTTD